MPKHVFVSKASQTDSAILSITHTSGVYFFPFKETAKSITDLNQIVHGKLYVKGMWIGDKANSLITPRKLTIGNSGKNFDGSSDVTWSLSDIGAAASNHTHSNYALSSHNHDGTYFKVNAATTKGTGDIYLELNRGTNASWKILNTRGDLIFQNNYTSAVTAYFDVLTLNYNTGNASLKGDFTASKIKLKSGADTHILLAGGGTKAVNDFATSGHTHNYAGSSSAGGAANSAVKLSTARTFTIGNTGKTFDGSGNVSWTLSEIGAAASNHTHSYASVSHNHDTVYLKLSGGTLTGSGNPILTLKRSAANSGAFIKYQNNNQTTNSWRVGMDSAGNFDFAYNETSKAYFDASGNLTATSFKKSGGTSTQILLADGTVLATSTFAPASHSHSNYLTAHDYRIATKDQVGHVKPWKFHTASATGPTAATDATAIAVNAYTTTAGRYYAVEMDKDGHMFVNVPWVDTNTHYTTTLYAGAKDAKSNAATTNGNSYIKLYDDDTVRAQLNIKGTGLATVTTDANGAIIINGATPSSVSSATEAHHLSTTSLVAKDDLNTKTSAGLYVTSLTSVCSSLVNGPTGRVDGELWMNVINCGNTNNGSQTLLTKNAVSFNYWIRVFNSGFFGEWQKILTNNNTSLSGDTVKIDGVSKTFLSSHQSLAAYLKIDGSNATAAGESKMLSLLADGDSNITDDTDIITSHSSGYSSTNNLFYKRNGSYFWGYIKGKADSVYQPKGSYAASSHTHDLLKLNAGNFTTQAGDNTLIYTRASKDSNGTATGNFPATDNSNVALTINRHPGNYYSQIGFSSDGHLYYRSKSGGALTNSTTDWKRIAWFDEITWNNLSGKPSTFTPSSHTHSYLPLAGGNMSGALTFLSTAASAATNSPTALSYGRLQAWGNLCINANTDNSGTEYLILTAGHGLSDSITDGVAIGTNTFTWKGNAVCTETVADTKINDALSWESI